MNRSSFRHILFPFLPLLLWPLLLMGQPSYYQVNGHYVGYNDIHFASDTAGWVVGDSGVIGHWIPSNDEWVDRSDSLAHRLRGVHFPAIDTGWVVGDSGTVLHTDDGGTNWNLQSTSTGFDLHDVHFISTDSGWAVGDSGTILHSSDSGTNWTAQNSGTAGTLRGVQFVNDTLGWAVGDTGVILRTTDAGSNWSQIAMAPDSLYDLSFVSETKGWVVGSGRLRMETTDGGMTWDTGHYSGGDYERYRAIHLQDSSTGWIFGDKEEGFYRDDSIWASVFGYYYESTRAIHFFSPDTGWQVVNDGGGTIRYYTDARPTLTDLLEEKNTAQEKIDVYPQPFQTRVRFRFKGEEFPTSFRLYTLKGEKVRSDEFTRRRRYTLSREDLPSGPYIYLFRNEKGIVATGRVVAE